MGMFYIYMSRKEHNYHDKMQSTCSMTRVVLCTLLVQYTLYVYMYDNVLIYLVKVEYSVDWTDNAGRPSTKHLLQL